MHDRAPTMLLSVEDLQRKSSARIHLSINALAGNNNGAAPEANIASAGDKNHALSSGVPTAAVTDTNVKTEPPQDNKNSSDFAAIILGTMRLGNKAASKKAESTAIKEEASKDTEETAEEPASNASPALCLRRSDNSVVSIILNNNDSTNESPGPQLQDPISHSPELKEVDRDGESLKNILQDMRTDTEKIQSALQTDQLDGQAIEMVSSLQRRLDLHIKRFVNGEQSSRSENANPGIPAARVPLMRDESSVISSHRDILQSAPLMTTSASDTTYTAKIKDSEPRVAAEPREEPRRSNNVLSVVEPSPIFHPGQSIPTFPPFRNQGILGSGPALPAGQPFCQPHSVAYNNAFPQPLGGSCVAYPAGIIGYPYAYMPRGLPIPTMTGGQLQFPDSLASKPQQLAHLAHLSRPSASFQGLEPDRCDAPVQYINQSFANGGSVNVIPRKSRTPVLSRSRKRFRSDGDDHVRCYQCGTRSTPEWRRGPSGFRTLCNACGLFHAKIAKKKGNEEANRLLRQRPPVNKY